MPKRPLHFAAYLPNASRNFGLEGLTKHDERYAWADEYVDVTYKLWEGSWEDDALVQDRDSGVHADYDKIHRIDHEGPRYKKLFGHGDRLPETHPAARYRGAFAPLGARS